MLFKFIFKKAVPVPKIENYDSYLFIGPHPDDIEIGAGATAAKLVQQGKKVTFLIVTDGRYGTYNNKLEVEELIETRQSEAKAAASHLGVSDVIFLPFADGGLYDIKDMTIAIAKQIATIKPDVIFAPDPQLPNEMHLDHLHCGNASSYAVIMSMTYGMMKDLGVDAKSDVKAIALYYTARPNRYVRVSKTLRFAYDAVLLHKSQFPTDTPEQKKIVKLLWLYFNLHTIRYGLRCFSRHAQGFRVWSVMHIHCAPEAVNL